MFLILERKIQSFAIRWLDDDGNCFISVISKWTDLLDWIWIVISLKSVC